MPYLALGLWLLTLGLAFLTLPFYRLVLAIVIGISYFLWGVFIHYHDHTLHLRVILEYLVFSLLAVMILVFISLRA